MLRWVRGNAVSFLIVFVISFVHWDPILDATVADPASLEFGAAFCERILRQNDAMILAGSLPRAEGEEELRELKRRNS
jgi:hypothetical protein